jgi:hypothetical protein
MQIAAVFRLQAAQNSGISVAYFRTSNFLQQEAL